MFFQLLEQETKNKQEQGNSPYNFDKYFTQMQELVSEKKASARVRFLMQVDLVVFHRVSSLQIIFYRT